MQKNIKKITRVLFLSVVLLFVPGCALKNWWNKVRSNESTAANSVVDGSEALLSINGTTVISANQFEDYFQQFVAANPKLQQVIHLLPDAKSSVFSGMVNEEILLAWANNNHVKDSAEYQKDFEQAQRMISRALAAKYFEQKLFGDINISDDELLKFYEDNKTTSPEFLLSQGGVKVSFVSFATKDKAQAFLDKVKAQPQQFATIAKQDNVVSQNTLVNNVSSDVDKNVKDKVALIKTYPSVVLIDGIDKKFYVVVALSNEAPKYRSLDQIRDPLKDALKRKKIEEMYGKKLEELRKEYNIVENKSYFQQKQATPDVNELSNGNGEQEAEDILLNDNDAMQALAAEPKAL